MTSRCLNKDNCQNKLNLFKMDTPAPPLKIRHVGRYCVAGAPGSLCCKNNSYTEGITMQQFPKDPVLRSKWVKFVQRHRCDFNEPVCKYAALCSAHFEGNSFNTNI